MKIVSRSEERSDERGRQFSLPQIISIIPSFGWDNSIIIFAFIRPDLDNFHHSFILHIDIVLVALTDKVQCLTSFMKTMAASQSAIDSFQTSVLLLQTRVGIRQQRDKELARPHKK